MTRAALQLNPKTTIMGHARRATLSTNKCSVQPQLIPANPSGTITWVAFDGTSTIQFRTTRNRLKKRSNTTHIDHHFPKVHLSLTSRGDLWRFSRRIPYAMGCNSEPIWMSLPPAQAHNESNCQWWPAILLWARVVDHLAAHMTTITYITQQTRWLSEGQPRAHSLLEGYLGRHKHLVDRVESARPRPSPTVIASSIVLQVNSFFASMPRPGSLPLKPSPTQRWITSRVRLCMSVSNKSRATWGTSARYLWISHAPSPRNPSLAPSKTRDDRFSPRFSRRLASTRQVLDTYKVWTISWPVYTSTAEKS